MNKTKIPWVSPVSGRGFTLNPITGCTHVSEGCDNCYAERVCERFHIPFTVTLHPERLREPLKMKKPAWIFLESMGCLFHPDVPDAFRDQVMAVIAMTPQHHYWLLTKRAAEMETYIKNRLMRIALTLNKINLPKPLPNLALGVTVENQRHMDRVEHLLATPAACRFVSHEPALGPLELRDDYDPIGGLRTNLEMLDWVISGGESGTGARPAHPDWFRSVRDQCAEAGVPFFFKQHGRYKPVGTTRAGHLLDGVEHHNWPNWATEATC